MHDRLGLFGWLLFDPSLQCAVGVRSNQHNQKCQLSIFLQFHGEVDVFEYVVDYFVSLQYLSV